MTTTTLPNDLTGKAVLITGGTKGIGLATGLAFARQGAQVYLTHKWASVPDEETLATFAAAGDDIRPPVIVDADVAVDGDTVALLERIKADGHEQVEVFVSNVAFAAITGDVDTWKERSLLRSLDYSAWPFVGYLQHIKKLFGSYPRYAIGLSSDGTINYYPGYDFVAAAKTVLEVFCRYLNTHLFEEDIRLNVLSARPVSTESLEATFGPEFEPFLRKYGGDFHLIEPEEAADAVLALCSGWMDAVSGQVLLLDRGSDFENNLARLFERREELDLSVK